MVQNPPAVQEAWVPSPRGEDPLEKGMATHHPSILAWRIPWTGMPGWAIVRGVAKSRTQLSD